MAAPTKLNFKMYQGNTFSEVIRWESSTLVYKSITGISKAAPVVISATGHGLTNGWRFQVSNVLGMVDINSSDEYYIASDTTSNTVAINNINSLGFKDYTSGGVISYNQPVDLTGYTARMQLRTSIDSTTTIDEYTTANNKILIDTVNNVITISVDAVTTAGYSFSSAVYGLELVSPSGVVTTIMTGTITLVKEITR